MNRNWTSLSLVMLCLGVLPDGSHARAKAMEHHDISVSVHTPPARILVVDSQGRRAGADPLVTLSPEGLPPEDADHQYIGVLEEIPNTDVEVTNIPSGEPPFELSTSTHWYVRMVDGGPQTYTVSLTGTTDGVCKIRIRPDSGTDGILLPVVNLSILLAAGTVRTIRISYFPPQSFEPVIERVLMASDLPGDVSTACRLGQISPEGVCQSLKAKAEAAAKALTRGRTKAARGAVGAFLNELKAQGGKHVQEPALTILREEAEALLNPPAPKQVKPKSKPAAAAKTPPTPQR